MLQQKSQKTIDVPYITQLQRITCKIQTKQNFPRLFFLKEITPHIGRRFQVPEVVDNKVNSIKLLLNIKVKNTEL